MDVSVVVDGQRMVLRDGSYRLAPQSQKFIKFKFDLPADWNELTSFAYWQRCDDADEHYSAYLDSYDCVFLPPEITKGEYLMMLYGNGDNGVVGTTMPIRIVITDELLIADSSNTEITQSLYNQMLARINVLDFVENTYIASVSEAKTYIGLT